MDAKDMAETDKEMSARFAHTHARRTDPVTSHEAAAQIDAKTQLVRYEAAFKYAYANSEGLTAEEAAYAAGFNTDGGNHTKRVSDLKNAGIIERTWEYRRGSSGRRQIVWMWVPEAEREGRMF